MKAREYIIVILVALALTCIAIAISTISGKYLLHASQTHVQPTEEQSTNLFVVVFEFKKMNQNPDGGSDSFQLGVSVTYDLYNELKVGECLYNKCEYKNLTYFDNMKGYKAVVKDKYYGKINKSRGGKW